MQLNLFVNFEPWKEHLRSKRFIIRCLVFIKQLDLNFLPMSIVHNHLARNKSTHMYSCPICIIQCSMGSLTERLKYYLLCPPKILRNINQMHCLYSTSKTSFQTGFKVLSLVFVLKVLAPTIRIEKQTNNRTTITESKRKNSGDRIIMSIVHNHHWNGRELCTHLSGWHTDQKILLILFQCPSWWDLLLQGLQFAKCPKKW